MFFDMKEPASNVILAKKQASRTAFIYAALGFFWIIFSETITGSLLPDDHNIVIVSIIKGLLYVTTTAVLLYFLTHNSLMKLIDYDAKRRESERSKEVFFANLPGMAYRCKYDEDFTVEFVSKGAQELTGYDPDAFNAQNPPSGINLIAEEYRKSAVRRLKKLLAEHKSFRLEYEIIMASGARKWVLNMGQGVYDEEGQPIAIEGLLLDITERKQNEDRVKYIAEHHTLTGLHNRRYFEDFLAREETENSDRKRAVILLDLKKIHSFNTSYGYSYSESVILLITRQLAKWCPPGCSLFQVSFERIAVYVEGYEGKEALTALCESVIGQLESIQVRQSLDCNLGILEISETGTKSFDVIKNVSIAAARSEENRELPYYFFEQELKEKKDRESELREELSTIARSEDEDPLYFVYQPVFYSGRNEVMGLEALARLQSDKLGLVYPLEFIPLAEETQTIIPIGKKLLRKACLFIKELDALGFGEVAVAVNVSPIQILRSDFGKDLEAILDETGISPWRLTLEITETAFAASYETVNETVGRLRKLGISFAIDDFGTGHSSLARERMLNVDYVKLDKFFVDDLLVGNKKQSIIGEIISMQHKMGFKVIAEGVEYDEQKAYLEEHGCDYLQGYLLSRPLARESVLELLARTNS
ncbi:MAG: EAL domain-containing protein [Acidaminococcaceae bacterium]|nr:EAL domain-containing protein [Acidaminococcaceae bacterium]